MTEVSKKENLIASWFMWHFYQMPQFLFLIWKNFISFSLDFFSIPLLIATLFSPWRRYKWRYPGRFDIKGFFETLISNIFSRVVGAICRLFLIIVGIPVIVFMVLAGFIVILFWIIMPLVLVVLMFLLYAPLEV